MGMDLNIYAGPVFKVKIFDDEKVEKRKTCPIINCKNNGKRLDGSTFCSKCGTAIKEVDFMVKVQGDGLSDIDDKFKDLAFSPLGSDGIKINGQRYSIHIPNFGFSEHELDVDIDCDISYSSVSQDKIDKIMNDFYNDEDIKLIHEEYKRLIGEENIIVDFCIFTYHR